MVNRLKNNFNLNIETGKKYLPKYVLITPARNEEFFIERTIQSVIEQTVLPLKWVIVSDGSTDNTDHIVKSYSAKHDWIELVRTPERKERHFAGKVHAFNAGYARVNGLDYDIIGNLDADITFEDDYFEFILNKFLENPHLGVGGTPFKEDSFQYDYRFTNIEHVSGACQMFKRECFEEVGGYAPLEVGGIDLIAVTNARMKGWQTRTFTEKSYQHHRKMGSEIHRNLTCAIKGGYHDYQMGVNVVWQFFRSAYQMTNKPFVVSGCVLLTGYLWAMITRTERLVTEEFVAFRKKEQMSRLKNAIRNLFI